MKRRWLFNDSLAKKQSTTHPLRGWRQEQANILYQVALVQLFHFAKASCARTYSRINLLVVLFVLVSHWSATSWAQPASQPNADRPFVRQAPGYPPPPAAGTPGPAAGAPRAPGSSTPPKGDPLSTKPFSWELRSTDQKSRLVPGLAVQIKYQYDSKDQGADKERTNSNYVEIRRVRPSLNGTLLSETLSFYLHLSTSPGSIEIMDAYLNYSYHPQLAMRAGQWKIPFTRYRIQSYKNLTFTDWAIVSRAFGAERQLGLAVHNGYEKPPVFEYELGLFSGPNARASHGLGLSDLFGEETKNPSDLAHPGSRSEVHPELVAHVAYNSPGLKTTYDTDFEGGGPRFMVGLSTAWDLQPQDYHDLSLRLAPEVLAKVYGVSFSAIYYLAFRRKGEGLADQRKALMGALLQASYLLAGRLELSARYARVDADNKVLREAREHAAQIIAAAAEATQQALRSQYQNAGTIEKEQEITLGFNLYLLQRTIKWQNDMAWLIHTRLASTRTDLRFRSQLQLAF